MKKPEEYVTSDQYWDYDVVKLVARVQAETVEACAGYFDEQADHATKMQWRFRVEFFHRHAKAIRALLDKEPSK